MPKLELTKGVAPPRNAAEVLSPQALDFVGALHTELAATRRTLLAARHEAALEGGSRPGFPAADVRSGDWRVPPPPPDLEERRVEITGPVEAKMMINALNSGASVFMADFEDALSPTWDNVVVGQANLKAAVRRTLAFTSPEGKSYSLNERTAVLMVRPRGWHLEELHAEHDGRPASASLFDFGLYVFHNAAELLARGSGPYLYLPKLESAAEAALWHKAFTLAEGWLELPKGSIRATVLIENILAAFQMDEILHALGEHALALNAGRWDYIFSIIRKLRSSGLVLPDRSQITMTVPFMRAYSELLVKTCHARGAHAIGGMAAFIPSRKDAAVNERAIAKVREDKLREASDGFDGTWVAHPDLVGVARGIFDDALGRKPHQKDRLRDDVRVTADDLLDFRVGGGEVTEAGVRLNVNVGLQYLASWLSGVGAAGIDNLMEDMATAEISRSQLWQWLHAGACLADGRRLDAALYGSIRDEEVARLGAAAGPALTEAVAILDALVLPEQFTDFATLVAYPRLVKRQEAQR